MDEHFSVLFLSIMATISLENGLIGGMLGCLLGRFGRESTFRWFVSYALIGVFCVYVFNALVGRNGLTFQSQFNIFLPVFASIGFVFSGIFKYRFKDFDLRLLALFPLFGILAAVLYQSQGYFWWSFVVGAIIGGVAWYFTSSRMRSILVFMGAGFLTTYLLFVYRYSLLAHISVIIIGCLAGGLSGWFIERQTIKRTIAIGAISMLTGGTVEYTISSLGLLPILIVGTLTGLLGIFISGSHHRELITFIAFGGVFLSALVVGWETLKSVESISLLGS